MFSKRLTVFAAFTILCTYAHAQRNTNNGNDNRNGPENTSNRNGPENTNNRNGPENTSRPGNENRMPNDKSERGQVIANALENLKRKIPERINDKAKGIKNGLAQFQITEGRLSFRKPDFKPIRLEILDLSQRTANGSEIRMRGSMMRPDGSGPNANSSGPGRMNRRRVPPKVADFDEREYSVSETHANVSVPDSLTGAAGQQGAVRADRIRVMSSMEGSAVVTIDAYILLTDGNITQNEGADEEVWEVRRGQIKYTVTLSNWSFCDAADCDGQQARYIDLALRLDYDDTDDQSGGNRPRVTPPTERAKRFSKRVRESWPPRRGIVPRDLNDTEMGAGRAANESRGEERRRRSVVFSRGEADTGSMLAPVSYMADREWMQMEEGFPKLTMRDGQDVIIFRFARFNDSLVYDPTVEPSAISEPTDSSGESGASHTTLAYSSLIFFIITAFISYL